MNIPLSLNLFPQIRTYGNELLKTANAFCDHHIKLAKTYQKLQFNLRCKRTDVFPKSIIMQPPIRTEEAYNYFQKTVPRQTLKFFINDNHRQIQFLHSSITNLEYVLRNGLPNNLFNNLKEKASNNYEITKLTEKRRLINKYENLSTRYGVNRVNINIKSVRNISSKPLTEKQNQVLERGLNFNTGLTKKDILNLVATLDQEILH